MEIKENDLYIYIKSVMTKWMEFQTQRFSLKSVMIKADPNAESALLFRV